MSFVRFVSEGPIVALASFVIWKFSDAVTSSQFERFREKPAAPAPNLPQSSRQIS